MRPMLASLTVLWSWIPNRSSPLAAVRGMQRQSQILWFLKTKEAEVLPSRARDVLLENLDTSIISWASRDWETAAQQHFLNAKDTPVNTVQLDICTCPHGVDLCVVCSIEHFAGRVTLPTYDCSWHCFYTWKNASAFKVAQQVQKIYIWFNFLE